jgi:hypothetical protein
MFCLSSRETSRADVLSAVQKAAGGTAEPLSVEVVTQGQLAASALLRLPSAALAARIKERLSSKLLSPHANVVFFPDRLKHGNKFVRDLGSLKNLDQDHNFFFALKVLSSEIDLAEIGSLNKSSLKSEARKFSEKLVLPPSFIVTAPSPTAVRNLETNSQCGNEIH